MAKPRAVIVGGKGFNVSKQFHQYFEIVKHFDQDTNGKVTPVKDVDIILVIRDFVDHSTIGNVSATFPGVPIVAARNGWSHMYMELERRKLLPVPETPVEMTTTEVAEAILEDVLPVIQSEPLQVDPEPATPVVQVPKPEVCEPEREEEKKDDRIEYLMELFKMSGGETTEEVSQLYRERYDERIPGPLAGAARRRLGIVSPRAAAAEPALAVVAQNPALKESLGLMQAADKIVSRRNELLRQREQIDRDIASLEAELKVYAPLIQHVEQIKMLTARVRTDLERRAEQTRRMGMSGT